MITPGLSSTVVLPQRAYVLDWVFADGPPGNARIYDNNGRQDFHSILPSNMTEEEYWAEEEQRIYTRLLQERREREEAIRMKVSCNRPIALKSSYRVFGWEKESNSDGSDLFLECLDGGSRGRSGPKRGIFGGDAGWLYPTKSGGRVRSAPL